MTPNFSSSIQSNTVQSKPGIASVSAYSNQYAGFLVRWAAFSIDVFIIQLPVLILVLLGVFQGLLNLSWLVVLIPLFVDVYFISRFGATPGKMLYGLRVVKSDGSPLDLKTVILREFVGKMILGGWNLGIAFDKEKRGIHDKIAKTSVIIIKPLSNLKKFFVLLLIIASIIYAVALLFLILWAFGHLIG